MCKFFPGNMGIIQNKVAAAAVPHGETGLRGTLNIQPVIVIVIGIKNIDRISGAFYMGDLGILKNSACWRILRHLCGRQIGVVLWSPGLFRRTIENILLTGGKLIEIFWGMPQITADPAEPGRQSRTCIPSEVSALSISEREVFIVVSNVLLSGETYTFQLVGTLGALGACPCLLQSRQQHGGKNGDDGNNNQ